MKFTLGFLAGVGAAWTALAIWQHRAIPDIDPADVPDVAQPRALPAFELPEDQRYYIFSEDSCPNSDHPFWHRCGLCGFKRGES